MLFIGARLSTAAVGAGFHGAESGAARGGNFHHRCDLDRFCLLANCRHMLGRGCRAQFQDQYR